MLSAQRRAIQHLRELVAALDLRLPRVERMDEARIAREAAALRADAMHRIIELERAIGLATPTEANSQS